MFANLFLNVQTIIKTWVLLGPVALSLIILDLSPQNLVKNEIRLFHICVPTAHNGTA